MIIENVESLEEKYEIVYSDPPWRQKKGGLRKSRPNQTRELDYSTMTLGDIETFHREFLENNTTDSHTVFMWAIDKFLPETEKMMSKLGYKLHARMVWDKENGVAPAFTVRYTHEYLLWYYKTPMMKISVDQRGKFTTCFREKSTKHSKKPMLAYEMIEKLYPNAKKIELFARNEREGWDSFGNEVATKVS